MPITQDRLKKIVDAGQSIFATYLAQCETLGRLVSEYRNGRVSLDAVLEYAESRAIRPDVAVARELVILNTEMYRYQFTHNKNNQEAERIARRREEKRRGLARGTLTPWSRQNKLQPNRASPKPADDTPIPTWNPGRDIPLPDAGITGQALTFGDNSGGNTSITPEQRALFEAEMAKGDSGDGTK